MGGHDASGAVDAAMIELQLTFCAAWLLSFAGIMRSILRRDRVAIVAGRRHAVPVLWWEWVSAGLCSTVIGIVAAACLHAWPARADGLASQCKATPGTPSKPPPAELWHGLRPDCVISDGSAYDSLSIPGLGSSAPFFADVVRAGGDLVVGTNAGLSVYRPTGRCGGLVSHVSAWTNQWLVQLPTSELDEFVREVDAFQTGATTYIAVAGAGGMGASIWTYSPSRRPDLRQHYQSSKVDATDAALVETGGGIRALIASQAGIEVLDVSGAEANGACLESVEHPCGISLGRIPVTESARQVSAINVDGKIFAAWFDGRTTHLDRLSIDLLVRVEVARISGASAPTLVQWADKLLLAASGSASVDLYDIGRCVDSIAGCQATPVASVPVRDIGRAGSNLSASFDGGRLYLYRGSSAEVRGLGTGALVEVDADLHARRIDQGIAIVDPCHGQPVDYIGWYSPQNRSGTNHTQPRHGVVLGGKLYRVDRALFDRHSIVPLAPPKPPDKIFADGFETGDTSKWQ